ncbi:uncharacterized protein N7511_008450 [Penicillium nucicola]|uniref:uncharacterized protein n=1 Tax=Penicillium nucicola TaxID=1850975 RepID=UPI002544FA8F|nr:uncharacterized protein N7511_008450 [Penicillium nucicola]KAJ5751485.1 hypothetical protein N7511_008450 [Penicillium nucicola]
MAESQNPAPGLIGSTAFAIYWSASLFKMIQNVKSRRKQARDLAKELESLQEILQRFRNSIDATPENSLVDLGFPLLQCGNACKVFEEKIDRSSKLSGVTIIDFRDWAHLKYMDEDIDAFRRLLASYKTAFIVALANADGSKTNIPADGREHYKDLAENAVVDLEAHLESIDRRLNDLRTESSTKSEINTEEIRLTTAERKSLQKCLQVCIHFSSRIDDIPHNVKNKKISSHCLPERADVGLREDMKSLLNMETKLESHMKALMDRILSKFMAAANSPQNIEDMIRLQEEWETIRQCMRICIRAENDLNGNVSTIHNYAAGDAIQFIVSTNGNAIKGENRASGWRTRQVGGHISDASLQPLAKDMASVNFSDVDDETLSHAVEENQRNSGLEERYGRGFTLRTKESVSDGGFWTSSARSGPRHTPEAHSRALTGSFILGSDRHESEE